jgi:hypothetical protein
MPFVYRHVFLVPVFRQQKISKMILQLALSSISTSTR